MTINTIGVVAGILGPMNRAFATELPPAADSDSGSSTTSITLTIPSSFSIDITPSTNGTFVKSDSKSINVKTDNSSGYTLSIKANSNNDLVNGNNKLPSITNTEGISEDNYKTSGLVNTWGYIPSKLNGKDNTNIMPGPTSTDTIIEKTTNAGSNTNNAYSIALAAKINNSTPSGTYKNNFIITAIANTRSYSITYDLTGGTWDEAKNSNPQIGETTGNSVKLYETIPTRPIEEGWFDFSFQGWCDQKPVTNTNPGGTDTCLGTTYKSGNDFPIHDGENNITLYAIWYKGCGCFAPDTLIDTTEGLKRIGEITYGTKVYSYDFEHNQIVEDTVEGVFEISRDDLIKVSFDDDSSIQGTLPHQFYVQSLDDWIPLKNFKVGDTLHTVNGSDTTIKSIERINREAKVYNLQTAKYHNYFIVTPQDGNKYIVKAVIPDDLDEDDDYLLREYQIMPMSIC